MQETVKSKAKNKLFKFLFTLNLFLKKFQRIIEHIITCMGALVVLCVQYVLIERKKLLDIKMLNATADLTTDLSQTSERSISQITSSLTHLSDSSRLSTMLFPFGLVVQKL